MFEEREVQLAKARKPETRLNWFRLMEESCETRLEAGRRGILKL